VKQIGHELVAEPLNVVIFGTSSTGKTSLVNALLGHRVGDTAPTLGTTTAGVSHTYTLPGEGGTIALTDTPGLQVRGRVGEVEAKELARNGDLLLFAIAADITGHERAELATLADLGKRVILVFNKSDRYLPEEIDDIVASLKRKTRKLLLPQNIVTVAADPVPLKVRRYNTDGSFCETYEDQPPLTEALTGRLVAILQREGSQLRLANAMQKTRRLAEGVAAEIAQSRRLQGERIVQQMQWATAGAVAITPLPALDLLAAAAINARTIGQLHTLYERKISLKRAERTAKVLAKLVLQLGGVEIATQTVGSILKASPLAALGIPLQAVSAAYITRVAGLGYLDWLASETTWDEASMLERLRTQLQTTNRTAFLQQFVRQAVQAAKQRLLPENETALPQTSRRKPRPLPLSNEEPVRLPLLDTVVEASDRQLAAG
jgi:small GTP-binding protein